MKANVLEKPIRPVKHVYIKVIIENMVVSTIEKNKEIIHNINTFENMYSIL